MVSSQTAPVDEGQVGEGLVDVPNVGEVVVKAVGGMPVGGFTELFRAIQGKSQSIFPNSRCPFHPCICSV